MESLHRFTVEPAIEPGVLRPWLRLGNKRTRLAIESILLGLAIILAVIWFSAPYFARDYINRGLSGLPDYIGRVEWVRLHPWTASADIYDLHLDKNTGGIPVHFFYSPRWNVSLQWSQIFHGVERASVIIYDPQINFVAGPRTHCKSLLRQIQAQARWSRASYMKA